MVFPFQAQAEETNDSATLQEKLKAIEHQVNENHNNFVESESSLKPLIPEVPIFATETFSIKIYKEPQSFQKTDQGKKEFGSVTASLKGGKFTSFSYSSTGLDLKENYGLTLLLKTHDLEIRDVEREQSLRETFISRHDLPSEFGMSMYQEMKALVPKQEKTKNYTMTGMGLNLSLGGFNLGIINYIIPPEKKRKVFYGANTQGPYNLNITSILPGSEEVKLEGGTLTKGADYQINYTRGEITFINVIPSTQEIIIEYELASGSGSEPSKFTGIRLDNMPEEKNKGKSTGTVDSESSSNGQTPAANGEKHFLYGLSYFNDELIKYSQDGDQINEDLTDHTLMGFDTKFKLGTKHSFSLEFANGSGDKQKELGLFASKIFTPADTEASDDDPKGPYYLDKEKLPVVKDTEEIYINSVLIGKDKYSLDPTDGRLIFKGNDLNILITDEIEVRYRYLTEQNRVSGSTNVRSGTAYAFSTENKFNRIRNSFSYQKISPYFTMVGNRSSSNILDMKEEISWDVIDGLGLYFGFAHNENLNDATANLKTINKKFDWMLNYKRGERLDFSYKRATENRFDNKEIHNMDTKKVSQNFSLGYKFNNKYQLDFQGSTGSMDGAKIGSEYSTDDKNYTLNIKTKPLKGIRFDTSLTRGDSLTSRPESNTSSSKHEKKYKLRYVPNENIVFFADRSQNQFRNTGSADNGSENTRLGLNYKISEKTTFFTLWQGKREQFSGNEETSNLNLYDLKMKPTKKLDMQIKTNTLSVSRVTSDTDTNQKTIQMEYQPGKTDKWKTRFIWNVQTTDVGVFQKDGTAIFTNTVSADRTFGFRLNRYYKKYPLDIETTRKLTKNTTAAVPETREIIYKMQIEIPFIKTTSLQTDYLTSARNGNQNTTEQELSVSLNGKISQNGTLSLTFKSKRYKDRDEYSASTHENIWLMNGSFKW
ncbi:MAG: hypothetical protein AB1798_13610 [Spirochaetota bacterium]